MSDNYLSKLLFERVLPWLEKFFSEWRTKNNLLREQENWESHKKQYLKTLSGEYKEIKLFGKSNRVELEGIFTHVYVHDKTSAEKLFNINSLHKWSFTNYHKDSERHNGLELLKTDLKKKNSVEQWFILGGPGAGKTTFLKYITLQAARGKIKKIPIFVTLYVWMDFLRENQQQDFDLIPFLVKEFELYQFPQAENFIKHLLSNGEALLLLDGLDEIKQESDERKRMVDALSNFSRKYRKCTILLTCREAANNYYFSGQFKYLEVADFTDEEIKIFVQKWFGKNKELSEKFIQDFYKSENNGLRELGKIPILITLLCLYYEQYGEFPTQRADIYDKAVKALLEGWDEERRIERDEIYQNLSKKHKIQLFAKIANENFEQNLYLFEEDKLADKISYLLGKLLNSEEIDGKVILKGIAAQHGIFVERYKDMYSFAHLSFQEYFTSRYIVDNQEDSLTGLIQNVTESRWREVFLLTVSLLDNADDFFLQLQEYIDSLIADDEDLLRLLRWVDDKAKASKMPYKLSIKRILYYSFVLKTHNTTGFAAATAIAINGDSDSYNCDRLLALASCLVRTFDLALKRDQQLNITRRIIASNPNLDGSALINSNNLEFGNDRDFVHAIDLDLDRAITLNFALNQTLALNIALKIFYKLTLILSYLDLNDEKTKKLVEEYKLLEKYHQLFNSLIERAGSEGMMTLVGKLKPLRQEQDWKVVVNELEILVQEYFYSGQEFSKFTDEQSEKLEKYFKANELLAVCLKLAKVTEREQIENNIILRPIEK